MWRWAPPSRVPTLDRLLACYGADVERLGRALKEVRGKLVARDSGTDPEFTAKVREALVQLGYQKPASED